MRRDRRGPLPSVLDECAEDFLWEARGLTGEAEDGSAVDGCDGLGSTGKRVFQWAKPALAVTVDPWP